MRKGSFMTREATLRKMAEMVRAKADELGLEIASDATLDQIVEALRNHVLPKHREKFRRQN